MPPHIDQNRSFDERLKDFGPELGNFLARVWKARATIDTSQFDVGVDQIYEMYSGSSADRRFKMSKLDKFLRQLRLVAGSHTVYCQSLQTSLNLSSKFIKVHRWTLWVEFFHVLSSPQPAQSIRTRVYIHATNPLASLEILQRIVGQFGLVAGLWEVKTCGPGSRRLDTIVAYLYDTASRDALISVLLNLAKTKADLFTDPLPPLVKREGVGIGSADEPPAIEVYEGGGDRHSFGSFFSTLAWVALKNTPELRTPKADGRHMLDNMLYSLRLLRVDPRNPQRFPQASALEQWYLTSVGNA